MHVANVHTVLAGRCEEDGRSPRSRHALPLPWLRQASAAWLPQHGGGAALAATSSPPPGARSPTCGPACVRQAAVQGARAAAGVRPAWGCRNACQRAADCVAQHEGPGPAS
eukprot:scaffold69597_cov31-Tisochrysis_lutea.AAC.6